MIDPEDYPVTANRGYRHPPDDVGGVGVANDVPGDLARLAEDVDVDVQAVADAAAASVQTSRTISAGSGLSGGGDLSADRTLSIAAGGVTSGMIAAGAVGDAAISGGVAAGKIAGTALVASTVDAKGDLLAATGADTVGRLPVGADGEVLVADSGEASGIGWKSLAEADVARASQVGNLLTENVATGTDTLGTTSGFTFSACTGESSTEWAERGTRSLKITATGSQPSVYTSPSTTTGALVDDDKAQYTVGYTLYVPSGSDFIGAPWRTFFYCYDAGGTVLATKGQVPYALVEGVNRGLDTFTVPAGTAYVRARIFAYGVSLYGTAYMDSIGIWKGAGGEWVAPGTPVPNTQGAAYVSSPAAITLNRARPVLDATGTFTATLPTASENAGVKFTIINSGTGTVTVDGITGLTIPGKGQVEVISTGSAWTVLSGRYSTNTVGLASYEWNHADNGWRLVRYDSGARSITLNGTWAALGADSYNAIQRHNNLVTLMVYADSGSDDSLYTVPTGFQPYPYTSTGTWQNTTGSLFGPARYNYSDKIVRVYGYTSGNLMLSMTWPTSTTLPTSLPGTQVTAPA